MRAGNSSSRRCIAWAGLFGAIGVAMGAFGAHALRPILPLQVMTIFETAVRYHLFHALALLGCGMLLELYPDRSRLLGWAAWAFAAGIVLFPGSLYALTMTDQRWLGLVAPLGGVAWVAGWALLAVAFWRGTGA
jgi:uncharacterized membrane protein YgdD (TMEM256/DUF423 family)